jgi:YebC/PmpR family DNA-binding regulatory protein
MSGHSKWSQIKRKKEKTDQARGRIFGKLIREITIAARMGGGDPDGNPRLRAAINTAKASAMPAANIDRAIKKGSGELEGSSFEEFTYEGYAPGGVALMVDVLTDNRNRTTSEIRHILNRAGGNLGESGCVGFLFTDHGSIQVDRKVCDEEALLELAAEAGATDVGTDNDDYYEVLTEPSLVHQVARFLEKKSIPHHDVRRIKVPTTTVVLDRETAGKLLKLMDQLDEHDDVQSVWANFDIPDEVMASLTSAA